MVRRDAPAYLRAECPRPETGSITIFTGTSLAAEPHYVDLTEDERERIKAEYVLAPEEAKMQFWDLHGPYGFDDLEGEAA